MNQHIHEAIQVCSCGFNAYQEIQVLVKFLTQMAGVRRAPGMTHLRNFPALEERLLLLLQKHEGSLK